MGTRERIIVVGAGVAGLAAAFRLQQSGFEVLVLEAQSTVGGRVATVERDGFMFDTGAIILSRRYPQIQNLIAELHIAHETTAASSIIAVPRLGRLHHVHVDSVSKNLPLELISWRSKISAIGLACRVLRYRSAMDWFDLSRALPLDTESGYDYLSRHCSTELRDSLIAPMFRGLYLEDIRDMSVIDLLFIFNHYFGDALFSFRDGIATLPRAMAAKLNVRCMTHVHEVIQTTAGVHVACHTAGLGEYVEDASACVIALTAPQMAAIHPQLPSELQEIARKTRYSRILNVQLALNRAPTDPAIAVMLPAGECPELCSIFLDHNKNPLQAPPGAGLATVFWDNSIGARLWDLDDEQIVQRTAQAAARILPGLDMQLRFGIVTRRDPGIIIPQPGAYASLAPLMRWRNAASRIQIAGDYFTGGSANSALCSGERAAALLTRAFL